MLKGSAWQKRSYTILRSDLRRAREWPGPVGIVEVRELFRDLAINHGVTIFISSHILGEISRLATRIGIIHQGKMVQEIECGSARASPA